MKLPGSSVIAPLLLAVGMAACSSNPDMGLIDPMGSVADPGDEPGSMSTQAQFLNDPVEMARTWEAAMVSLPDGQGGVFYKAAKPGQDRRVDLPVIGASTLEAAHKAGLEGVIIEAGGVMVRELEAVCRLADELGLFFQVRRP